MEGETSEGEQMISKMPDMTVKVKTGHSTR